MRDRRRLADIAFIAACLLALGLFLWLGSGLTFVRDEWSAIRLSDQWSFDAVMRPVNEHWAPLTRIGWNSLMATVGMRSYVPYQVVDLLLVVAIASGIYVYARRQTHTLVALAVGVVFLFLGSGSENLFLAFQMGWTGAAAAGTWALVILLREPRPAHAWLASLLLLVAVMVFAGIGLFFVAAAAATVIISPVRRRQWWVIVPAVAAYGAWYLTYGRDTIRDLPPPDAVATFVQDGIANAVGQVSGLGPEIGLVIAVLIGVAAIGNIAGVERQQLGLIAGAVGLASQWVLIAIARAEALPQTFTAGRYVHISAIFILVAIVGWLGHRRLGPPGDRLRILVAVGALTAVSLAWNLDRVTFFRDHFNAGAEQYRAGISLLLTYGGSSAIADDRGLLPGPGATIDLAESGGPALVPPRPALESLIERLGSPLDDPLAIAGTSVSDEVLDLAFARFVADAMVITPDAAPLRGASPDFIGSADVDLDASGACTTVTASGAGAHLDLAVPSGGSMTWTSDVDGVAQVILSLNGTYAGAADSFGLVSGESTRIDIPDIGAGETLWLRYLPPVAATTTLCQSDGDEEPLLSGPADIDDIVIRPAQVDPQVVTHPDVLATHDVEMGRTAAGCATIDPIDSDPWVVSHVPAGKGLFLDLEKGGPVQVFLDGDGGYSEGQIRATRGSRRSAGDLHAVGLRTLRLAHPHRSAPGPNGHVVRDRRRVGLSSRLADLAFAGACLLSLASLLWLGARHDVLHRRMAGPAAR